MLKKLLTLTLECDKLVYVAPIAILRGWRFMRDIITLECTECKNRNYTTKKNKQQHRERLETKKYCKFCKEHTVHRETK